MTAEMQSQPRLQVWRSRSDNSEVIVCRGWLEVETCDELQALIEQALADRVHRLRLDLEGLDGIDEAGRACLDKTLMRCQILGIALEISRS